MAPLVRLGFLGRSKQGQHDQASSSGRENPPMTINSVFLLALGWFFPLNVQAGKLFSSAIAISPMELRYGNMRGQYSNVQLSLNGAAAHISKDSYSAGWSRG